MRLDRKCNSIIKERRVRMSVQIRECAERKKPIIHSNYREIEFDILRITAMFAVILVHAFGTDGLAIGEWKWKELTFIRSLVTWEVPIFVMISGRFFLDPERSVSLRKIWGKYIPHIVFSFVFWDIVYQVHYYFSDVYSGLNWKGILSEILISPYHFWYLYMIICLYAITPFLRRISVDKRLTEYFILLFIIFEFLMNYGIHMPYIGGTLSTILNKTAFHFTLGYSGYYLLGYYIFRYGIPDKYEKILYFSGIAITLLTGIGSVYLKMVGSSVDISGYLMPNIIWEATAVYTFAVKRIRKISIPIMVRRFITQTAQYSFGIYLIHALVLEYVGKLGMPRILSVLLTFITSSIMIFAIKKIPLLGKKVV